MPYFKDSQQLEGVLVGFFRKLAAHPEIGARLKQSKIIVQFAYQEPDLSITIDCSGEGIEITSNDTGKKPEVLMKMKADTAHRFWFGKVNLLMALTRREITAKGPIPKILRLLPVIKPAYQLYPQYLKESGQEGLLL
ncbi:MAG: hypothetical protein A3I75_06435 [Deltaproteobacteria bacterium RIFCSPLOWO2_02_FULL_50_16]|nr:MAG: hypothetical protein A2053_05035 [Deltaproteobacteria bacterium GWA2_50_8]OGQ29409.1 MAG: hypothetical protein A3B79_01465 [Deltaproteobacteria bacterium RIFCSPHIGHO2_02_FULL_50_15]OGQ56067.1 MAG: hypothetical protein A3I75_06435 [Deltaproteobacteria bacterium RIFCSPLOWO2_02_FULL_50_16]OGQ65725.1 MAG: hypothetical protein A3F89_00190 [Deltaproteobacteria bacterium RIFCSPLOWO2_12_FULL_50_11]